MPFPPPVKRTRKQKAADLWSLLGQGPSFLTGPDAEAYRLWVNSWVRPLLKQVAPDLSEHEVRTTAQKDEEWFRHAQKSKR